MWLYFKANNALQLEMPAEHVQSHWEVELEE